MQQIKGITCFFAVGFLSKVSIGAKFDLGFTKGQSVDVTPWWVLPHTTLYPEPELIHKAKIVQL